MMLQEAFTVDTSIVVAVAAIVGGVTGMFTTVFGYMEKRRVRDDLVEDRRAAEERAERLALKVEQSARDAQKRTEGVIKKIDENTEISKDAFTAANNHTEKLVAVKQTAVVTMETIMSILRENQLSLAKMDGKIDETRRLVELRLGTQDRGATPGV